MTLARNGRPEHHFDYRLVRAHGLPYSIVDVAVISAPAARALIRRTDR
jgi:hypothetical protein